jgi:hypothetical protein
MYALRKKEDSFMRKLGAPVRSTAKPLDEFVSNLIIAQWHIKILTELTHRDTQQRLRHGDTSLQEWG